MKKKLVLLLVVIAVFSLIASFGFSSEKPAGKGGEKKAEMPLVGFGMYFYQDQWWKDMKTAALETAAKVGIKLNVADADGDAAKQVSQLEAFIGTPIKFQVEALYTQEQFDVVML